MKNQNIDVSVDGLENAHKQLESYRKIADEIDKTGKLSAETNRMILRDHQELIHVMGDEIAMRELIQEKILETEEVAINYYKNILLENDVYYRQMLASNQDLFNKIATIYGINFDNYKNMSQAMVAVANATSKEMAKAMSMNIAVNQGFSSSVSKDSGGGELFARRNEITKRINEIKKQMSGGGVITNPALQMELKAQEKLLAEINERQNTMPITKVSAEINSQYEQKVTAGVGTWVQLEEETIDIGLQEEENGGEALKRVTIRARLIE